MSTELKKRLTKTTSTSLSSASKPATDNKLERSHTTLGTSVDASVATSVTTFPSLGSSACYQVPIL
jgi:hypothetical protein